MPVLQSLQMSPESPDHLPSSAVGPAACAPVNEGSEDAARAEIGEDGTEPEESKLSARRYWQQGCDHVQDGQWAQAVLSFGQATLADADDAVYWFNLANAQRHVHDYESALKAARRGQSLEPTSALGMQLVGECLSRLHRYEEAAQALAAMQEAGHDDASCQLLQGSNLIALGRHQEAVTVLMKALMTTPHLVRGHALLADALRDMGLKRQAIECMKTVLALEPGNLETLSHLSFTKRHVGDWSDLDMDLRQIQSCLLPQKPQRPRVAAAFGLLSLPLTPRQHLLAAQGEALAAEHGVVPFEPRQGLSECLDDPITVGFLSFDFREHPVSQLLVEVLEKMDRQGLRLNLYSSGPDDQSALRARVQASADSFVDIRGMSDEQAAARIRADGVHVLVDLTGHTRGHRLGVFARRPAPVQASYLGYPGSTGANFIDYLIGDPFVTPVEFAAHYSEKLAQLPHGLQPNGRWRPLPQPMARSAAGLPEDALVLCAFNHTYKILPETFDLWCQALREAPKAVLWLKDTNGETRSNLRHQAELRGLDPARLVFAKPVPYQNHFSRLALADLFVDTWPYNAHTTASDALWAGVPVLTMSGPTYAARVATSVLAAVGLAELAFDNPQDYLLALRALVLEPELLQPYRDHLQQQRLQLPLFDSDAQAHALSELLMRMVKRWRQGLAPAHLLAEQTAEAAAQAEHESTGQHA